MAELIGGSGYDDVQDTAPTSPSIGDTWLDTSTDPPTGKIYADLGSGGQWTTDLLDSPVSEAGQGVDWASETVGEASGIVTPSTEGETTVVSVNGSGYLLYAGLGHQDKNGSDKGRVYIDGSQEFSYGFDVSGNSESTGQFMYDGTFEGTRVEVSGIFRFESSLELKVYVDYAGPTFTGVTHYVLD